MQQTFFDQVKERIHGVLKAIFTTPPPPKPDHEKSPHELRYELLCRQIELKEETERLEREMYFREVHGWW